MLKSWHFIPVACLLSLSAHAAGVDLAADTITRDPYGAIVAGGEVVIKRKDETLKADQVVYDAANQQLRADGHVVIESENGIIEAESAQMHTTDKTGQLHRAKVTLKSGERISAETIERHDANNMSAEDVTFTSCPPDSETWTLRAASAELDQEAATLTATHARLELGGIPLLYTPYWYQVLKRKSGVLLPYISAGKVRGTEYALPLYLAPADNWDMTLTPHWMTARGLMGELEFRHASHNGHIKLQGEGINDKKTSSSRSRLRADIEEKLPFDINFTAHADHLSDRLYLGDFGTDNADTSSRYLQSYASLAQGFEYGEWSLLASHQQDLLAASNAGTLQILPRFESGIHLPLFSDAAIIHLDQQSTQFSRTVGLHGTRVDVHPWLEIPMRFANGGISSTLEAGYRHTRYWLKDAVIVGSKMPTRSTFEASLENRIYFERISDDRRWRHSITPILRYDYISAPDQSQLPNFDSAFGQLTMSNLLGGNRFSGRDRIERLNRISALLETALQHKSDADSAAITHLLLRVGAAYELKRDTVDAGLIAAPTRPFSNLLGEIVISPVEGITLSANGQYDPAQKYMATANANLSMNSEAGHTLSASWQRTDARYTTASEYATATANLQMTRRMALFGSWQYDLLLRQTQQGSGGFRYRHPCWDMSLEGYRYRLSGTNVSSDIGVRFLIGFKGLGSVGS